MKIGLWILGMVFALVCANAALTTPASADCYHPVCQSNVGGLCGEDQVNWERNWHPRTWRQHLQPCGSGNVYGQGGVPMQMVRRPPVVMGYPGGYGGMGYGMPRGYGGIGGRFMGMMMQVIRRQTMHREERRTANVQGPEVRRVNQEATAAANADPVLPGIHIVHE